MAREDPHFRLRVPEQLKARMEAVAAENRRSINAEIVARLENSFEERSSLPSSIDQVAMTAMKDIMGAPYIGEQARERLGKMYEDMKRQETDNIRRYLAVVAEIIEQAKGRDGNKTDSN